jgi:hypothetical protein
MSRALIITADDFGLTSGINEGILRGHLDGMITATSVLAVGRACDEGLALLLETPTLDVGVHLALVGEDPPLTAPELIRLSWTTTARSCSVFAALQRLAWLLELDPAHVRLELSAQIEKVLEAGIRLTHLDAHQHVHLLPAVAAVVVELATEYGIPFVRIPHSRRLPSPPQSTRSLRHCVVVPPPPVCSRRARTWAWTKLAILTRPSSWPDLSESRGRPSPLLMLSKSMRIRVTRTTQILSALPGVATSGGAELSLLMDPDVRAQIEDLGYRIVGFSKLIRW